MEDHLYLLVVDSLLEVDRTVLAVAVGILLEGRRIDPEVDSHPVVGVRHTDPEVGRHILLEVQQESIHLACRMKSRYYRGEV